MSLEPPSGSRQEFSCFCPGCTLRANGSWCLALWPIFKFHPAQVIHWRKASLGNFCSCRSRRYLKARLKSWGPSGDASCSWFFRKVSAHLKHWTAHRSCITKVWCSQDSKYLFCNRSRLRSVQDYRGSQGSDKGVCQHPPLWWSLRRTIPRSLRAKQCTLSLSKRCYWALSPYG
jgi:hypothetical protein